MSNNMKTSNNDNPINQNKENKRKSFENAHTEHQNRNYGLDGIAIVLDKTEVYDDVDIANAAESLLITKALESHRAKLAPETDPNFDGEHCLDCEEEIPIERLALGKIFCFDCQTIKDEMEKRNRR